MDVIMAPWSKDELEELGPSLRSAIEPKAGREALKEVYDAKCPVCKELFNRKRDWQRFCSPTCRDEFHGRGHRPPMKAACEQCGELFVVKTPWQKFCKPSCRVKFFLAKTIEERKAKSARIEDRVSRIEKQLDQIEERLQQEEED